MKKLPHIPCLPGWLTALGIGLFALIPTYPYVRLVPAVLSLVIAAYCVLALLGRKNPEFTHILRSIFTTLVIVGSIIVTVTGGFIFHAGLGTPGAQCDYIVVLGAQVRDSGPSATLWERISKAYEYLTAHPGTIAIVSGGQGADEPMTEAQSMFDALVSMGIDPDRVWMEDRATSTWENLKFSLDIIEEKTGIRPDTIGVVSNEFHLFRTSMQARDNGVEIIGIPAKTGSFDRWLHYFIREIAGVWHYLILGGQYA